MLAPILFSQFFHIIINAMQEKPAQLQTQLIIEVERPRHRDGVRQVLLAAFATPGEADVVDSLRENCANYRALVGLIGKRVVGHVAFTPAQIVFDSGRVLSGMGLAPLAVLPDYQGQGGGSTLCKAGLAWMDVAKWPFVIVLGHPDYYPRFGFEPAARFGIRSAFPDVPEEAFMIRLLKGAGLSGSAGVAHYRPEFDQIT
jgi:putative acetyltransferase